MAGSQQLSCTPECMEGKRGNISHPTLVVRGVLPPQSVPVLSPQTAPSFQSSTAQRD